MHPATVLPEPQKSNRHVRAQRRVLTLEMTSRELRSAHALASDRRSPSCYGRCDGCRRRSASDPRVGAATTRRRRTWRQDEGDRHAAEVAELVSSVSSLRLDRSRRSRLSRTAAGDWRRPRSRRRGSATARDRQEGRRIVRRQRRCRARASHGHDWEFKPTAGGATRAR